MGAPGSPSSHEIRSNGAPAGARPRVGFDVSALEPPHSPGVRRVTRELIDALERRGRLDVVRLAPTDADGRRSLFAWRQEALPRAVEARRLVGLHSFTSAVALTGAGARVQTIHELPWRHDEPENAGAAHRLWAQLGPIRADRVITPTEHVARDLLATPGLAPSADRRG